MKRAMRLFLTLFIVILIGCSSSSNTTSTNTKNNVERTPTKNKANSTSVTKTPAASTSSSGGGRAKGSSAPTASSIPVNFYIPQNDPVPSGIIEQLSWGGKGGGPDDPSGDQVCGWCDAELGYDSITLTGFNPSQKLEALLYRTSEPDACATDTGEYVTTLNIQADPSGDFSATLTGSVDDLILVSIRDYYTGQEIWKNFYSPYGDWFICSVPDSCPGAPPQRLKVNNMAYVCTSADSVKLREGPGRSYATLKSLVPGADVKIISGPSCADNWSWWKVKTESGFIGWMSEGGDSTDTYFLCPRN